MLKQKLISISCFVSYLLGRSESIFPSVVVGHLQELVKLFPESRHNQLTKIASKLKQEFQELLGTTGVFIYPTFPDTAHYHYEIYHKLVDTSYMMVCTFQFYEIQFYN